MNWNMQFSATNIAKTLGIKIHYTRSWNGSAGKGTNHISLVTSAWSPGPMKRCERRTIQEIVFWLPYLNGGTRTHSRSTRAQCTHIHTLIKYYIRTKFCRKRKVSKNASKTALLWICTTQLTLLNAYKQLTIYMHVCMYLCIYVYKYMYIHTHTAREKEHTKNNLKFLMKSLLRF